MGFTLIELLVVIAIIAVLVAILLPGRAAGPGSGPSVAVPEQPQAVPESLSTVITKAHGIFPQAKVYGTESQGSAWITGSGWSWRVMLLPYMDQTGLYNQIDMSEWIQTRTGTNTPARVRNQVIAGFFCPSDPTDKTRGGYAGTNYAAMAEPRRGQSRSLPGIVRHGRSADDGRQLGG